jgi:acyl carrier protein
MPDELEIKQFIVTAFAPDLEAEQLPSDLDLLDSGIVNSLGLLRLISWVGQRYDIPVDEQDIAPAQFSSVSAITAFVQGARGGIPQLQLAI